MAKGKEYARHYDGLAGVDLSSDHTRVDGRRFPYAVNVWKDYAGENGGAVETVPGFRRIAEMPNGGEIFGIHRLGSDILVHAGTKLYLYGNFPNPMGTPISFEAVLPKPISVPYFTVTLDSDVAEVRAVMIGEDTGDFRPPEDAAIITDACEFDSGTHTLAVYDVKARTGDVLYIEIKRVGAEWGEDIRVILGERTSVTPSYTFSVPEDMELILSAVRSTGENIAALLTLDTSAHTVTVTANGLSVGETLSMTYSNGTVVVALYESMNERRSASFVMNGRLYILDGGNYLYYDGMAVYPVRSVGYVPTTYINIIPTGENADIGTPKEQRNMLSPRFRTTFLPKLTGAEKSIVLRLNEKGLSSVDSVIWNGVTLPSERYSVDLTEGEVTVNGLVPQDEGSHSAEITASKAVMSIEGVGENLTTVAEIIEGCTLCATFDGRVFLSGNPEYPSHIFYSERNETGYNDPSYFGILDYIVDGTDGAPIRSLLAVGDSLAVLKGEGANEGAVYYHYPREGSDLQPKIYPSKRGLSGIASVGTALSFHDDPVFLSKEGVEAIGRMSVTEERSIEHRSSLVDAKLTKLDLARASATVFGSYLVIASNGEMFLGDERQVYKGARGKAEYEWYYLDSIGVWSGQYEEYRYAESLPSALEGATVRYCNTCKRAAAECQCVGDDGHMDVPLGIAFDDYDEALYEVTDRRGEVVKTEGENAATVIFDTVTVTTGGRSEDYAVCYTVTQTKENGLKAALLTATGAMTGGVFKPCTVVTVIDGLLTFGTTNGVICAFNTDKREDGGMIRPKWYTFDGRTIFSGVATKMDNCGVPHMNKTTVKKSTVVKMKNLASMGAKIKVRTNRTVFHEAGRLAGGKLLFDDLDFSSLTFSVDGQSLFAVKEKEKKWVEKQYFIYSDTFRKPFAIFYLSYNYRIAGRFKEKEVT